MRAASRKTQREVTADRMGPLVGHKCRWGSRASDWATTGTAGGAQMPVQCAGGGGKKVIGPRGGEQKWA
jgi:hypothetical protein